MTSISSDGREAIERTLTKINPLPVDISEDDKSLDEVFEIPKCIEWISERVFSEVCLQFPDEYLRFSHKVAQRIQNSIKNIRTYILADSTYGSCCVDEKTSQHVPDADALIHFGPSCLSRCSGRIPVLYIFTKPQIEFKKLQNIYADNFGKEEKVILIYDVIYQNIVDGLYEQLKTNYPKLLKSTLILPESYSESLSESNSEKYIIKHRRVIPLKSYQELETYKIFFIGSRSLPNLLLSLPRHVFKVYDPSLTTTESLSTQKSTIDRLLRKRNYFIEKVKDAQKVGILVGTLSVQNYLDIIHRIKTILNQVGKKSYVVSIGEINPCKLGNFMDIECFVFVGCPEVVNYYLSDESKGEFYQPILTPFDIELAFCDPETEIQETPGEQYVTDWSFLIEKGLPKVNQSQEDVSLITGGLRSSGLTDAGQSIINWQGLDEKDQLSSDVTILHQGRSGIASGYSDEPSLS